MEKSKDEIEALWEDLLSRQEALIHQAFNQLDFQEQRAILNHLSRMVSEPGWHPEQVASARAAIKALKDKN